MLSIEVSESRGVRFLHFGSAWIQGAMRIARPFALELEYTRQMMFPLLLDPDPDWPRSVLQVGLGAASVTRFLHRHRPGARIVVVEIAPEVVAAARQFFNLPEDPVRVKIELSDASDYVAASRKRYDLILVDGFDEMGRAGRLDSTLFYRDCRARLEEDGMLAVNWLTRRRSAAASCERLEKAFERVLELPAAEAGNVVAIAGRGRPIEVPFDDLRAVAKALNAETGLNLGRTVSRLATRRGRRLVF